MGIVLEYTKTETFYEHIKLSNFAKYAAEISSNINMPADTRPGSAQVFIQPVWIKLPANSISTIYKSCGTYMMSELMWL